MVSGLATVWNEPAGSILLLTPVTLSVKLSGPERNRIRERRRKWERKKRKKKGGNKLREEFKTRRSMCSLQTPPSLVDVCVFALMPCKWQRLPTSFVLYRAEFGFQKGLRTHTHGNTEACTLPHTVLGVNWQVNARTLCVCWHLWHRNTYCRLEWRADGSLYGGDGERGESDGNEVYTQILFGETSWGRRLSQTFDLSSSHTHNRWRKQQLWIPKLGNASTQIGTNGI